MEISEVTRRAIIDEIILSEEHWSGRLEEPDFLARVYSVQEMPSGDPRFDDAYHDIWQHRVNNPFDWGDDWVFTDSRFALLHGDDDTFLRFLVETIHPVVRPDAEKAAELADTYNRHLRADGYELAPVSAISGRPVFAARSTLVAPPSLDYVREVAGDVDASYISQQITRMQAAIETDPELAIGTAKELIETCCKSVLSSRGLQVEERWDLPQLLKETAQELQLTPHEMPETAPAAETIRRVLGSLGNIVSGLAELRNAYGTGHGRGPGGGELHPRHARLAVGAASTLAAFLFETHEYRHN